MLRSWPSEQFDEGDRQTCRECDNGGQGRKHGASHARLEIVDRLVQSSFHLKTIGPGRQIAPLRIAEKAQSLARSRCLLGLESGTFQTLCRAVRIECDGSCLAEAPLDRNEDSRTGLGRRQRDGSLPIMKSVLSDLPTTFMIEIRDRYRNGCHG